MFITQITSLVDRPDRLVKNALLVVMPVLAATSYVIGSDLILLAIALFLPVLVFVANRVTIAEREWRDPQTGMGNAKALKAQLSKELSTAPSFQRTVCIVLDIDAFEEIEQDWGAAACDEAIAETGTRLRGMLRADDDLFRLSRTRFGIVVSTVRSPETSAVIAVCDRMQSAAADPIQIDGGTLRLTVSAGFCMDSRSPKRNATSMLKAAQAALAEARKNAPSATRGFSPKTFVPVETDLSNEVLDALKEGQIRPWFQPQISTDTGEITGFEALARWDHPTQGSLSPAAFLPALEAANRMEELSESILNHALRALVAWDKAGVLVPSIAVNFATQELRNPSLVERIKWDVDRFELDPSRLTVEILETVISENDDDIITRNIRALGAQGFRIDLDDFGTGHASLANIRRFAVDRIKIDRSFVAHVDSDPEQQRMIAAIVGLGERLEIETLAEGVENIGEQSILSQLGCNHLQGFAIARPMPFEKTIDWIEQHQKTLNTTPLLNRRAC